MAVALEGASIGFIAIYTGHYAYTNICQQRSIHILAAGIFNLLAERRPVIGRANLEIGSFYGQN